VAYEVQDNVLDPILELLSEEGFYTVVADT